MKQSWKTYRCTLCGDSEGKRGACILKLTPRSFPILEPSHCPFTGSPVQWDGREVKIIKVPRKSKSVRSRKGMKYKHSEAFLEKQRKKAEAKQGS